LVNGAINADSSGILKPSQLVSQLVSQSVSHKRLVQEATEEAGGNNNNNNKDSILVQKFTFQNLATFK
jgi:hypothetical protein